MLRTCLGVPCIPVNDCIGPSSQTLLSARIVTAMPKRMLGISCGYAHAGRLSDSTSKPPPQNVKDGSCMGAWDIVDSLRSIMKLKNGTLAATARNQSFRNRPARHPGGGFLLTASDGACRHAQFSELRAAGCGISFGKDHSYNRSFSLMGVVRDAGRAEIRAAIQIMHWSWCPTEVLIDRQGHLDGLKRIAKGLPCKGFANADLLDQARRIWEAKGGVTFFKFTKVTAHGRGGPQQDPLHTAYNEAADKLAWPPGELMQPNPREAQGC